MRTVLVIDDLDYVANYTALLLHSLGYNALVYSDPDKMMYEARQMGDLVAGFIIDVELGPWRGEDVAQRVWNELDIAAPVILYSGGGKVDSVGGRPVAFLAKPFKAEDLKTRLKEAGFDLEPALLP